MSPSISMFSETKYISGYNLTVNPQFPVVNVGNKANPSYLPADVCIVLPGQPADAKLTPDQTANMISFAVRNPKANATSIVGRGLASLGFDPQNATLVKSLPEITNSGGLLTCIGQLRDRCF